jgi:hypothetical protein
MASSSNRYYGRTASDQSLPPSKGDSLPLMPQPAALASPDGQPDIQTLAQEDQVWPLPPANTADSNLPQLLKRHIRRLRFASRLLTTLLSLAAFVPIAITLRTFLATQSTYRAAPTPAGGTVTRTAWHADTRPWPTYMYFAAALASLALNGAIFGFYALSVAAANRAHVAAVTFDAVVLVANLVVWIVAAALYRAERDKGGVPNDIWGWACSAGAKEIQKAFQDEVNFDSLCNVQTGSWVVGVVQVVGLVLSAVIWVFVFKRRKSKRTLRDSVGRGLLPEQAQ